MVPLHYKHNATTPSPARTSNRESSRGKGITPIQTARTVGGGSRKAGLLLEGEFQRAPALTIHRIVVSGRTEHIRQMAYLCMSGGYFRGCWGGAKRFSEDNPINDWQHEGALKEAARHGGLRCLQSQEGLSQGV